MVNASSHPKGSDSSSISIGDPFRLRLSQLLTLVAGPAWPKGYRAFNNPDSRVTTLILILDKSALDSLTTHEDQASSSEKELPAAGFVDSLSESNDKKHGIDRQPPRWAFVIAAHVLCVTNSGPLPCGISLAEPSGGPWESQSRVCSLHARAAKLGFTSSSPSAG